MIAVASGGDSAYAASKFGLEGWMESLHAEIAPIGITTTVVNPGSFRTELLTELSTSLLFDDPANVTSRPFAGPALPRLRATSSSRDVWRLPNLQAYFDVLAIRDTEGVRVSADHDVVLGRAHTAEREASG